MTIASVHPQTTAALHAPDAAADKPVKRKTDTDERNNALRLAVVGFNDHWRHQKHREDEMSAVVNELCDPGPKPKTTPSSGAHH
ncbi:hypothetical protein [Brevundimonas sp.]|uniref:hypothetical protein n=1 Tax=Brevundimonas sp. TaxID=1871086 RepID=UPI00356A48DC